jgi:hypothetical protein
MPVTGIDTVAATDTVAALLAAMAPRPAGTPAVGQLVTVSAASPLALAYADTTEVTPAAIGLGSVDNTADANKPISSVAQTALDGKAPTRPVPAAGRYVLTCGQNQATTSATLGVGTLRLSPMLLDVAWTIDRIGAEITTIGEAGSKLRLGIYSDNGRCFPGSLLLDAGQIAGDSATGQDITVAQVIPAGLYWIGAAVQTVTVTQPTVRCIAQTWTPPVLMPVNQSAPSNNTAATGLSMTGVTGALPASFSSTVTASTVGPRVWVRLA